MSNYFQVLKRIEQDRGRRPEAAPTGGDEHPAPDAPASTRALRALSSSPSPAAVPAAPPPAPPQVMPPPPQPSPSLATSTLAASVRAPARPEAAARVEPPSRPEPPRRAERPAAHLSGESERGIATLFDTIRAIASGRATRTLVFAGAAASDSVHAVSDGLARHAERHGMSAFVAELVAGANGPTLVPRGAEGARETFAVDLNGGAAPGELSGWLERAAAGSELVLLEGPPLAQSIDAALLACACDGLVIVADAEVTPRAALHAAAERAQIAGCRTFGVVMTGTKDRTPTWMRRLLGNDERAPRRGGA